MAKYLAGVGVSAGSVRGVIQSEGLGERREGRLTDSSPEIAG